MSIHIGTVMNGNPHIQNLRSVSLAGLSSVTTIFLGACSRFDAEVPN